MKLNKFVRCAGRSSFDLLQVHGSICNVSSSRNRTTRRYMQTITDVRQYLKSVVGAKHSYSDGKPDRSNLQAFLAQEQISLATRTMQDSLQNVVIPLSDKTFREKYINIHNRVRFGQLLENLDSFAVLIAYHHNEPMLTDTGISPLSIVTAMVDEVRIHHHKIDVESDIIMTGHVTWSGRSSLEIGMWLTQEDAPILDAQFVMVARDAESKKSAIVHPLKPVTDGEKAVFEQGNRNKLRRLEEAKESLFATPPTVEEKELVHNLFLSTLDTRSKSFRSRILPEGSVWLEDTRLKNAVVCFPQKRNIHNKVFGGYLMRKGYELAWANACVFSKSVPNCIAMDDIIFHCPVPIGSLLLMSSQINYVEGNCFSSRVHAEVMNPSTGESRTSNVFHFSFTCDADLPVVVPRTYGESMLYLDGRRRLKNQSTVK